MEDDYSPFDSRVKENSSEWKDSIDAVHLDFCYSKNIICWAKLPESSELNVGLSRLHHTAVSWHECIYIFGGCVATDATTELPNQNSLNDMICFNINDRVWRTVKPKTKAPAPRSNHTAIVYQNCMMIFGGYSNPANKNDVHQFRFDLEQWTPWVHIRGEQPNPRTAHCSFVYGDHMWIFGGYDGKNKLNDMWKIPLNQDKPNWKQVEQLGQIHPPVLHTVCAVIDTNLFTFSGQAGASFSNNLLCFSLLSNTWSVVLPDLINNACPAPERRYGHTMVAHDKSLYIFGGQTTSRLPNDLYCFNTESLTWEILKYRNRICKNVPSSRSYHAATMIDNIMFISGGVITSSNKRPGTENFYCFTFASFPGSTLREDLAALLDSGDLCDLEFIVGECENKKSFNCHICIVATRSPYLKMRLLDQLNELLPANSSQSGNLLNVLNPDKKLQIKFPQLSPTAFLIVLKFIYTDRIPHNVWELDNSIITLTDVYTISALFQLTRLEKICIKYIQNYINIDNAITALKLAKARNLTELVDVLESFIIHENNFKTIIASSEFEQLEKAIIVGLIRQKTASCNNIRTPHISNETVQQTLEDDLKMLMDDKQLADVTLTVDGFERCAHRAVLAARCKYFSAMYRSLPPVNDRVGIKIGDLEPTPEAFTSLMKFIYYNDTDMPPEDSLYLFTADKFYGFTNNQLQAYCKKSLETNIKPSNVIDILKASEEVNSKDMKFHALHIIADNFTTVQPLPGFSSLSKSLLLEVTGHLALHLKKNKVKM